MSHEAHENILTKYFGVLAAISAGGILEMCGGAPQDRPQFTVAATCFAASLPMSITGYIISSHFELRKRLKEYGTRAEETTVFSLLILSSATAFLGLFAMFEFFAPAAAGVFLVLSVVGFVLGVRSARHTNDLVAAEVARSRDDEPADAEDRPGREEIDRLDIENREMQAAMGRLDRRDRPPTA